MGPGLVTSSAFEERLIAMLTPVAQGLGYDLWRVQMAGGKQRPTLQVMAEPLDGRQMTVEDCATLSRAVSALLDVEDPIGGAYRLEVSSPGIDRPLVRPEHFRRFLGHDAKVEVTMPVDGRRRFTGRLEAADADRLRLVDADGRDWDLAMADIAKAKLVLTDRLIAEAMAAPAGQDSDPAVAR